MRRLSGIETEYGIHVNNVDNVDVVTESMELIRCYHKRNFIAKWDYALENPRLDMRGFEVDNLRNDQDEFDQLQRDLERKITLQELKSDLLIRNGGRLYNDHTHPEFSTPECLGLFDLVAFDRAGERIMLHCARQRTIARGEGGVQLFKNNTDFDGHSYGTHENFLVRRDVPFQTLIEGLLPFIVTRQIFSGAGKVGVEGEIEGIGLLYQLSQRSDFFEVITSVDTMERRPLVNSRDEPHADPKHWRRLHLIFGDANMCEWSTALKVGTMALVIDLLEDGCIPALVLADPIQSLKNISRDSTYSWAVSMSSGMHLSAIEIQRYYLEVADFEYKGRDEETDWVLEQWEYALNTLGSDHSQLVGKCDWITKKWLLDGFAESQGLDWECEDDFSWLQSQDLQYHNIDPNEGLSLFLEKHGLIERLILDEVIEKAMIIPPSDTRAHFRGMVLQKFSSHIRSLNWDSIEFEVDKKVYKVDLKKCVSCNSVRNYNSVIDVSNSIHDFIYGMNSLFRVETSIGDE